MSQPIEYPWYGVVQGTMLEQGDLLRDCPRFFLPPSASSADAEVHGQKGWVDAIILTQSCDLILRTDGECEATEVLLCPYFQKKDLANHPLFHKDEPWEEARKGRRPYFHVLNGCLLAGHEQDFVLVDFHDLFTLPVPLLREFADKAGDRLRLMPPYREHLSQAFARLFMRVGLPADIPPFGKKK